MIEHKWGQWQKGERCFLSFFFGFCSKSIYLSFFLSSFRSFFLREHLASFFQSHHTAYFNLQSFAFTVDIQLTQIFNVNTILTLSSSACGSNGDKCFFLFFFRCHPALYPFSHPDYSDANDNEVFQAMEAQAMNPISIGSVQVSTSSMLHAFILIKLSSFSDHVPSTASDVENPMQPSCLKVWRVFSDAFLFITDVKSVYLH